MLWQPILPPEAHRWTITMKRRLRLPRLRRCCSPIRSLSLTILGTMTWICRLMIVRSRPAVKHRYLLLLLPRLRRRRRKHRSAPLASEVIVERVSGVVKSEYRRLHRRPRPRRRCLRVTGVKLCHSSTTRFPRLWEVRRAC